MYRPLSSKTLINFLTQGKFDMEPIYVRTPDGYVLEVTRLSFMTIDDDEDTVFPVLLSQYTDIEADIESSIGEQYSNLPPS